MASEELTAYLDELMTQPLSHEERCHLLTHNLPLQCRSMYVPHDMSLQPAQHRMHTDELLLQ